MRNVSDLRMAIDLFPLYRLMHLEFYDLGRPETELKQFTWEAKFGGVISSVWVLTYKATLIIDFKFLIALSL